MFIKTNKRIIHVKNEDLVITKFEGKFNGKIDVWSINVGKKNERDGKVLEFGTEQIRDEVFDELFICLSKNKNIDISKYIDF